MSSSFISKHNKAPPKLREAKKARRRGYVFTCVPLSVGWTVGLSTGLQRKDRRGFNQNVHGGRVSDQNRPSLPLSMDLGILILTLDFH